MFSIDYAITNPELENNPELVNEANIKRLAKSWELKSPIVKKEVGKNTYSLESINFKGKIVVESCTLKVNGDFTALFHFDKNSAEQHLRQWVGLLFNSSVEL